jgi:hypothetical protein
MAEQTLRNAGSQDSSWHPVASVWRGGLWVVALCLGMACLGVGCASTVKQAAREAAPAAVKEGVEQAQKPETRADVAEILADPRIRDATTALSAAVVEGMLNGLTDAEHTQRLERLTDALVARATATIARSFRTEIAPQLSKMVADTLDQSLQRVLDAQTEQRLQALATVVARSTVRGMSDALLDPSGRPTPVLRQAFGQVVQEVGYQAAFGFEHAVQDAREGAGPEAAPSGGVLATVGRLADWSRGIPVLVVGGLGVLLLLLAGGLAWALISLSRLRRTHA